ncbi:LysR family transcriptional regulator [Deinococcus cellulosilyticus]|uniref:Hydrogen peroxide-inducible protein n=1 Tax=Deinococcus cellulosilyticus (strain DSM 18568 / NBRC 106333 / KACC 11606 / 5516J-15) TaxID=1223518 RepID=A0A511N0B7_DEIC1|nr:LysR family transcriptional regulator [Deinococcus cellulosilyticus]GEM46283.1 hydrogen peroxide-inducible protein [Deinococcus cellulosilyticus NBRC 106333 = KACC 11606]
MFSMAFQPTLAQLRAFTAVVEHQGFSRAAAALGVTQSSLSHSVSSLEQGLNAVLLTRHARGITLTQKGTLVLIRARTILQLTMQLVEETAAEEVLSGMVSIACYRSVATHLLPVVMQHLYSQHPGIRLDIFDGCLNREDASREVLEGHCQLGIAHLPADSRLQAFPILTDPYVLVLPSNTPDIQNWEDLKDLPFIRFGREAHADEPSWTHLKPVLSLQEESSVLAMVASRMGFSILPRLTTEPHPAGVRLQGLPVFAARTLGVVTRAETLLLPHVRVVLDLLCNPQVLKASTLHQGPVHRV